jgi:hypothetical protein
VGIHHIKSHTHNHNRNSLCYIPGDTMNIKHLFWLRCRFCHVKKHPDRMMLDTCFECVGKKIKEAGK